MSWSVIIIGTPEKISTALDEHSTKCEGQSKVEFDDALPHMKALVNQNFGSDNPVVKIIANGHGYAEGEVQKQRYFSLTIERFYGSVV